MPAPLFIPDVARELRVSQDSVRDYIKSGKLFAYKLAGVGPWRIDPEAVEAFLQASREEAAEAQKPVVYVAGKCSLPKPKTSKPSRDIRKIRRPPASCL